MQQSYTFFRACVIYSHTCMYPNQLLDIDPESERKIQRCAAESMFLSLLSLTSLGWQILVCFNAPEPMGARLCMPKTLKPSSTQQSNPC